MKTKINIETWNRKEHFLFFKQMEEPFFGITTTIDCTKGYEEAKKLGVSFFVYYLHKTLVAVHAVENFRYRIDNDEVVLYETICASATVMRADKTFGFSYMEFADNIHEFADIVATEIDRIQHTTGIFTREYPENIIHFSALPWVDFTSISHARSFTWPDSCPKISFGKMTDQNGKKTMALSVHVHHGLVDGYHVGLFLEKLQELL
ncbi:MAG: chloramphenicol acetyltransferase [Flavobacterium sp.]|jgi:chloramphenicol O-acetyltransferase type A|nr:chloramphenicol acetyltransferase [Flavobacterium sp.]